MDTFENIKNKEIQIIYDYNLKLFPIEGSYLIASDNPDVLNQFEKNKSVLRPDTGLTFSESWEAKLGVPTKKGITVEVSNTDTLIKIMLYIKNNYKTVDLSTLASEFHFTEPYLSRMIKSGTGCLSGF